ncbi:MAG: ROK family protein, partial [Clostridia bacterium]|nr:ROK family protein [Clostridia bacterium]
SSKQGMTAYMRQQISRGRESVMADAIKDGVFRSKKLVKALEAGDQVAMEAVDRACHWLAVATGNLINTISPDLVLYGGGVIEALGDTFLKKILAEVDRYCMPTIRSTVEIKTASLGDDSILYGDLAMIKGLG